MTLLLRLLFCFTLSEAHPCEDFCLIPEPTTNATIGQETIVQLYCNANASSLKWLTIPGREEVNATTFLREDGIRVSSFTILVAARNNKTNIACCIYRRGSDDKCSNTTLLIYTEGEQCMYTAAF